MTNEQTGLWARITHALSVFRLAGRDTRLASARKAQPKPKPIPYAPKQKPDADWEPSFLATPEQLTEPHASMTTLQRQYLYHFMMGMSLEEIKKLYGVSARSVDQSFKRIRENLGANSNAHAVAKMVWWKIFENS